MAEPPRAAPRSLTGTVVRVSVGGGEGAGGAGHMQEDKFKLARALGLTSHVNVMWLLLLGMETGVCPGSVRCHMFLSSCFLNPPPASYFLTQ